MSGYVWHILIATPIIAVLAFGTVEPWSAALAAVLTACVFIIFSRRDTIDFLWFIPGAVPLLLLMFYTLFQLIPVPAGLLIHLSPNTYALYRDTVGAFDQLGWLPLSINPQQTIGEFFSILSFALLYLLTVQILSERTALRKSLGVLAVFALLLAFFAIIQHLLNNNKLYWMRTLAQGGAPFGPFVNRNHYAGLAAMLFPVVIAHFLYYKPASTSGALRQRLTDALAQPFANRHILFGFSAVLVGLSVFLSLSRGGIVSLCLSMALFGLMLIKHLQSTRRGLIMLAVFIVIAYAVGWFGWDPVFKRFESIRDAGGDITETRLIVWKDSIRMAKDFPLTGTGMGTYQSLYPAYRSFPGNQIVDHAHNDYIELFTDGGIIAFLLAAWFLFEVGRNAWSTIKARKDLYAVYMTLGALAGIAAVLLHSVTDFGLHIGANRMMLALMLGIAVTAANTRQHGASVSLLRQVPVPKYLRLRIVSGILLSLFVMYHGSTLVARSFASQALKPPTGERTSSREAACGSLTHAVRLAPLNAAYRNALGRACGSRADSSLALAAYRDAVRLDPANASFLQDYGIAAGRAGSTETADRLIAEGARLDKQNPARQKLHALWLLSLGDKKRAGEVIAACLQLEPQRAREYISMMVLHGFSGFEIFVNMPQDPRLYFTLVDHLEKTGEKEMASYVFDRTVKLVDQEKKPERGVLFQISRQYEKQNHVTEALATMERAARTYPVDTGIRLAVARLLEKNGETLRAEEAYRSVLELDPKNATARERLRKLED